MINNMASRNENEELEKNVQAWRNKTERVQKSEILRELRKLQVQIVALERERATHLFSKRSEFRHDYSILEELENKISSERKSEGVKLRTQLEKISHMVKRFHKELKDVKPTPEFVEKLKVIMEEIEGTISAFKEQQRKQYEELLRDERTTFQEIQVLERKFESWSQINDSARSKKPTQPQAPLASARDITKDLPPQVAAFEKFLEETGGVRGGWDEYDHQTFLKFRLRHKARAIFIQHALLAIPTRTEEEIRDHEEWYQTYLALNEKKKESIKKWREKKEVEKDELVTKADTDMSKEQEEEERRQTRLKEKIEEEKQERFRKLNAWKVQKELERAQAEEKKLREALEKNRKEEEEKRRQEDVKCLVLEHKRKKDEEDKFMEEQKRMMDMEERERSRQLSAREIGRFRERDKKKIEEKLAKEKAKEEERREKEKRLERCKEQIEVERDPNRLLKPTAGWKSRTKEIGPSGSGPVLHMPHRAVPSWRQGLN